MSYLLSFMIRDWLVRALFLQWRRSLPKKERVLLDYWGATGNSKHHEFQWADKIPEHYTNEPGPL